MKNIKRIIFLLFTLVSADLFSQQDKSSTFLFQGVVYGYNHDPSKKSRKKGKQFVIEGLLSRVNVHVYSRDNLVYTGKTNRNG